MDATSAGDYIALVVQFQQGADGDWQIGVDGTEGSATFKLVPLTLVVRLWRSGSEGTVRGTIRLQDETTWAPFQSNAQLEQLLRQWLLGGDSANGRL